MKILLFKNLVINMNYFVVCNLVKENKENKENNKTNIKIILQVPHDLDSEFKIKIEDFNEIYYSKFKKYIEENPVDFMKHIKIMIDSFLINSQTNTLDLNAEVYNLLNAENKVI